MVVNGPRQPCHGPVSVTLQVAPTQTSTDPNRTPMLTMTLTLPSESDGGSPIPRHMLTKRGERETVLQSARGGRGAVHGVEIGWGLSVLIVHWTLFMQHAHNEIKSLLKAHFLRVGGNRKSLLFENARELF